MTSHEPRGPPPRGDAGRHLRLPEHRRSWTGRATRVEQLAALTDATALARGARPAAPGGGAGGSRRSRVDRAADSLAHVRAARAGMREIVEAFVAGTSRAVGCPRGRERGAPRPIRAGARGRRGGSLAIGHRHVGDPLDDALAAVAEPLVALVAAGETDRLRICANDGCRWVFHDTSPTGRRRWCSMASCGNRAKAARHRARKRDGPTGRRRDPERQPRARSLSVRPAAAPSAPSARRPTSGARSCRHSRGRRRRAAPGPTTSRPERTSGRARRPATPRDASATPSQ